MTDSLLSLLTWNWCSIILMLENSGMQKVTLTSCDVKYNPTAVLYSTLLDRILSSYYLVCLLLIMLPIAPLSHKHVRPATLLTFVSYPLDTKIFLKIVYISDDSCTDLWPPVWHRSLKHLERYWLTCLQVRTKKWPVPELNKFSACSTTRVFCEPNRRVSVFWIFSSLPTPLFLLCLFHPLTKQLLFLDDTQLWLCWTTAWAI